MQSVIPIETTSPADIAPVRAALKEWAVAVRALREGRQIFLLRKGGIREAGGEFEVEARRVLLFPTYLHEEEQRGSLQPCYESWLSDEHARKPEDETIRLEAWAEITDVLVVRQQDALYQLHSQHIYSDSFLRYRIENDPHKPLYCLFLRVYDLPQPVSIPMEMDYYGCKSWVNLQTPVDAAGSTPALGDHTYAERVRVIRRFLESPVG